MNNSEYNEYIKGALDLYPLYLKKLFIKKLRDKNLVITDSRKKSTSNSALDISIYNNVDERCYHIIDELNNSQSYFEDFEYNKEYKYSIIFKYDMDKFPLFVDKIMSCPYTKIINNGATEQAETTPSIAYVKKYSHSICLKLNFKYEPIDLDGNTVKFKYPIIIKFFDNGLLDIRFDRLQTKLYSASTDLYHRNILLIKKWILQNLNINIINIDMQSVVDRITRNEDSAVKYAQSMSSRTGGEATLKVNKDYVLPILGELKQLMIDNQDIFDKASDAKSLLEDFIEDIEETSDLPWISLCWKNKHKTKELIVRFSFNYMGEGYTLLQYQGLLRDVERMDQVVKCIASNME